MKKRREHGRVAVSLLFSRTLWIYVKPDLVPPLSPASVYGHCGAMLPLRASLSPSGIAITDVWKSLVTPANVPRFRPGRWWKTMSCRGT